MKKGRKKFLNKENIRKYILYAIGEVILITFGVLLAVNINKGIINKENQKLRCQYLEELNYTFEFDMIDVQENITAFEAWNPKIARLIGAIEEDKLSEIDSLNDKVNTLRRFIFFGQRTKTKMEELKNSYIDLIGNRKLKNKILLYQDEQIASLLIFERRYNIVDEEVRQYFSKNLYGENFKRGELEKMVKDKRFLSIARQKYNRNEGMRYTYDEILKEQLEIKALIEEEIENNCSH